MTCTCDKSDPILGPSAAACDCKQLIIPYESNMNGFVKVYVLARKERAWRTVEAGHSHENKIRKRRKR